MTTSTTAPPLFRVLRDTLVALMARLGVRSERGYYLGWVDEEALPPWVPDDPEDAYRHEQWCWPCVQQVSQQLDQARQDWEYWNGALLDTEGEPVEGVCSIGCYETGEGPYWCHACDAYVACGFTLCSIDTVLSTWEGQPLNPDILPEVLEALDYFGETLPHSCGVACGGAPFHPDWHPPDVDIDISRWWETAFVPVDVPCCGCLAPITMEARKARKRSDTVQRWQGIRALAERAIQHCSQEEASPCEAPKKGIPLQPEPF